MRGVFICNKEQLTFALFIIYSIYYTSKLSEQIEKGIYGIENVDYKYLVQDLIENEPELFR